MELITPDNYLEVTKSTVDISFYVWMQLRRVSQNNASYTCRPYRQILVEASCLWSNISVGSMPKCGNFMIKICFSDYKTGFGGKFGIQLDRQDKSALGWDHHEKSQKHESQTDHKVGFGGKFGVQTDRMDKSASNFDAPSKVGTNYAKTKPDIGGAKPSDLRAKFETMVTIPKP